MQAIYLRKPLPEASLWIMANAIGIVIGVLVIQALPGFSDMFKTPAFVTRGELTLVAFGWNIFGSVVAGCTFGLIQQLHWNGFWGSAPWGRQNSLSRLLALGVESSVYRGRRESEGQ